MIPSVQTDPMIEEQFSFPMVIFFGLDVNVDALQMYKMNLCLRPKTCIFEKWVLKNPRGFISRKCMFWVWDKDSFHTFVKQQHVLPAGANLSLIFDVYQSSE